MTTNKDIVVLSDISIIEQAGELVVDSRLIAIRLGVKHKATMQLIRANAEDLKEFGHLPFEMATVTNSVGALNQEIFCYLNEEQATYLMTLSRNTEQVKICKKQLVKAFSAAKKIITTTIPAQNDRIRELELQVQLADLDRQNLRQRDSMIAIYGTELGLTLIGHSGQVVEIEKLVTEIVNPQTNNTDRILTADQLKKVVKAKTGQNLKTAKQFADALVKAGRDDLLIPVTRNSTGLYPDADRIDEALSVVYGGSKQRMIAPIADTELRIERRVAI